MQRIKKKVRVVTAALLITGNCVGAGMLSLPVVTGPSGFLPTLFTNGFVYTDSTSKHQI